MRGGLTNNVRSVGDIWCSYQRITRGGGNAPFVISRNLENGVPNGIRQIQQRR